MFFWHRPAKELRSLTSSPMSGERLRLRIPPTAPPPWCPQAQINSYNTDRHTQKCLAYSKQFPEESVTVQEGWERVEG